MPEQPIAGSDIGRRLVLRRRQLGLTREEVAERAGIAPGYLRYVEEQVAAMPGLTFLLRVAEALETTVSQLHGGTAGLPPGMREAAANPTFTALDPDECRAMLSDHGVGRVVVTTQAGPVVLPVNYDVVDGAVVFRTAPSTEHSLAAGRDVAFEVDRIDEALSEGWSVLVLGHATGVTDPRTLRDIEAHTHTRPWPGGERDAWIRIRPVRVTGRRISAG